MSNKVAEMVTEQVIKGLEEGIIPWHKPWTSGSSAGFRNFATGHRYSGVNTLLLNVTSIRKGYAHPLFASYKQIAKLGGRVNKGERGHMVVFTKVMEVEDKDRPVLAGQDPIMKKIYLLRYYTVFNLSQTDLDPSDSRFAKYVGEAKPDTFNVIEQAEAVIAGTGARINTGGGQACFSPLLDVITMPAKADFDSERDYYDTAFHELVHWTGHESRLNRLTLTGFGTSEYALEELVAEIGANMVAFTIGMQEQVSRNSQAYINHWLQAIKAGDCTFVIKAASKAEKAAEALVPTA